MKKTFSLKTADIKRVWTLVDASDAPLGRVATAVAARLIGKYKPTYTAHIDDGDFVVVVNADKLVVSGTKLTTKKYYSYSGYPSGLTTKTLGDVMQQDSAKAVYEAVKGMLPRNKLAAERLKRLKIFPGETHDHTAQKPVKLELK